MIFGAKFENKKQELKQDIENGVTAVTVDPRLLLFCMESTEKSTLEYDEMTRKPSAFEKEEMRKHIVALQEEIGKLQARLETDVTPIMQENTGLKIQVSSLKQLVEKEKRKNETKLFFGEDNG